MNRILLAVAALVLCVGTEAARADDISIFADVAATSCSVTTTPNTLLNVYVVHWFNSQGATASQFMITNAKTTTGLTWLSTGLYDTTNYISIGDIATGISVAYGGCIMDPSFPILILTYFVTGTVPTCSMMQVVADPVVQQGTVITTNCNFAELSGNGGNFAFNPDQTCLCAADATEQSTWGKVKSLYR